MKELKKRTLYAGMLMAAVTIYSIPSLSYAGAQSARFTETIVGIDNPCTPEFDDIAGDIDFHVILQASNGVGFIKVIFGGAAEDVNGIAYVAHGQFTFAAHTDLVPFTAKFGVQLVSQGATDNASADAVVHVNGQGVVTKIDLDFAPVCNG